MDINHPEQLSALQLAFYGDSVYEKLVRRYLLSLGSYPAAQLHKMSTSLVCAKAQCEAIKVIMEELTEEELAIFKRGRNAHPSHSPKSASGHEYSYATGLECLFGWLSLKQNNDRINQLFKMIINSTQ